MQHPTPALPHPAGSQMAREGLNACFGLIHQNYTLNNASRWVKMTLIHKFCHEINIEMTTTNV